MNDIQSVYFIGAGGIGMSALERYFLSRGKQVAGYDRTPSELTDALIAEGIAIHFEDKVQCIPPAFLDKEHTLVVLTPAVPENHAELNYFRSHGFEIQKRAQVLGTITASSRALCVAGTHGKTTTSTMAAHLMHQSHVGGTGFLGGISNNYHSNLILDEKSPFTVIEADEYDRSFHWLHPEISVITSTDPDHLDIYGTPEGYLDSFRHYTSLIRPGGALILHRNLPLQPDLADGVRLYTYDRTEGDFHAEHIRIGGGEIHFDLVTPEYTLPDISLGVPVSINIENSIAAMAMALLAGATPEEVKQGMATFHGVARRFDFKIKTPEKALLTDYAHHPKEIEYSIHSLRELYPGKKLAVVFQPHLYSRTRDFRTEFSDALSLADIVILTDIYPARELPLPGITSTLLLEPLKGKVESHLCTKEQMAGVAAGTDADVIAVLGAGDIDTFVPELQKTLELKW